jgi:hypothetical protein
MRNYHYRYLVRLSEEQRLRPDGYIGLTGGSHDQEPIIDYLRDVIGR